MGKRKRIEPSRKGTKRLAYLLLGIGLLFLSTLYVHFMRPSLYAPTEDERALFRFVRSLPADALLAGDPCTLDGVPLFAQRKILFSCEAPHMATAGTITASLRAYYSAESSDVWQFCEEHGVDFMIVNETSFNSTKIRNKGYFFEPFTSTVEPDIDPYGSFALRQGAAEKGIFTRGPLAVVACQAFGEGESVGGTATRE